MTTLARPRPVLAAGSGRRWEPALPLAVFIIGFACSILATFQLARILHAGERQQFESQTIRIRARISERLEAYIGLMQGAASLMAAEPSLTRDRFDAYVRGLRFPGRYPGLVFIGFSRHVEPGGEEALVAEMHREGEPGFHLWPAKDPAEAAREGADAVVFLSPVTEGNGPTLGFDMRSEALRRAAMDRTLATSQAAATAQLPLISNADVKPLGFNIYLAVTGASGPIGYVYSSFRSTSLFEAIAADELGRTINIAAFDGAPLPANLLFSSAPGDDPAASVFQSSLPLTVAGRTWTLMFSASGAYERRSNPAFIPLVLAFGLFGTSLLTAVSWLQLRARVSAEKARADVDALNAGLERRVSDRTDALQQAQTQLRLQNETLEATVQARTAEVRATAEEARQFLHVVSHDLRAPLVNILGFLGELETLERERQEVERLTAGAPADPRLTEEVGEAIGFVRTSAQKLERLIGALLKLSREGRRALVAEPIAMTDLVRAVADGLRFQCEQRNATIRVGTLPDLTSDRLGVEQIFANLLENAVKYLRPDRPGEIAVSGRSDDTRLVYDVEDNGRGIAPADQTRIFEVFRRVATDQPGEGLGLASVKILARQLGAEITLFSAIGEGSRFRLSFPRRWIPPEA